MSDKLSKFIQNEIDTINLHLPRKIITLKQLMLLEKPGVFLRDGHFQTFGDDELERIKAMIPEKHWGHVRLPIIITRRRDLGGGAFVVGGSEANLYIIQKILDQNLPIYDSWKLRQKKEYTIYKYHLRKIRKAYPTVSSIAFA